MYTLDFETEEIIEESPTPPRPVGCAIREPDGKSFYYAFGHPEGNNCSQDQFVTYLKSIWHEPMLGYNIHGFDMKVAEYWFDLPPRDPLLTEDAMFLAYLKDPHVPSLRLKDLARDWLGIPPDNQEAMNNWILTNVPECRTLNQCGRFISRAPGDIVGPYAIDDCEMTYQLHMYLSTIQETQAVPYDRERTLAPILAGIKQQGIRIDMERLGKDALAAREKLFKLDDMIRKRLKSPNLNPGSDKELVLALQGAGFENFLLTPTGRLSANKASLEQVLSADPELKHMLRSRATYDTLVGTFMFPWMRLAEANGGTINPSYNQVRNPEGYGTRTGRLSSSNPNGQNIPGPQGDNEYEHHDYFGDPFPLMRSYCLPDPGTVWYSCDFKSQEPRLTAHFEDGLLLAAYIADPEMDPYIFVKDLCGGDVTRKDAKVILLGLIYAMGAAVLAQKLGCDISRATALRNAIRAQLPDVVTLDRDCKRRFEYGLPIKTLGGRLVYCEPPSNGRIWAYKALNLLIQGSAADQTKEAMIYAHEKLEEWRWKVRGRLLGSVHDEINLCAPENISADVFNMMQDAANALPCDVPMRITMGVGANWAEAAK